MLNACDAPMRENEIVTATIAAVHEYGLDIEVDGRVGFVQPVELNWSNTAQTTDFSVGTKVPVLVYAITPDRFYASIKRVTPDPLADPSRFALGTRHVGEVCTVRDWGYSIELPSDVFAVVLTPDRRTEFAIGLRLEVEVVLVDLRLRKLIVKPI